MWPFSRTKRARIDPHQHHAFLEPSDTAIAVSSGGGPFGVNSANVIGVTAASQRRTRCALPGCGKFHDDPIHTPADE